MKRFLIDALGVAVMIVGCGLFFSAFVFGVVVVYNLGGAG